jgi:hypothetical protein
MQISVSRRIAMSAEELWPHLAGRHANFIRRIGSRLSENDTTPPPLGDGLGGGGGALTAPVGAH